MKTSRGWLLGGVLAAMVATACGDNREKTIDAPVDTPEMTTSRQRGEYIVNVLGACSFCHTPLLANGSRDPDRFLGGIDCFIDIDNPPTFQNNNNGAGCLSTRNLTPHSTGIGAASDEAIKKALLDGVRTDGKKIVPIMPFWIFHNLTDDDAQAIVDYLRSITAVDHAVLANQPPFSNYNNGELNTGFPDVLPLRDDQIPYPRGGANNESAMRGRYLASAAGLCIDCHSPEIAPNALQLDVTKLFAGGKVFPKEQLGLIDVNNTYPFLIATRNLTSDATGLGGWTKAQIKAAIAEGRDRDNKQVCAATHGGVISPYSGLTDQDLDDIVEYLSLLPPIENDTAADPAAANCGPLPFPLFPPDPETGGECGDNLDDDGDTFPDDGCPVACGNCQGPTVP